jgi:hypothetical protein
MARLGTFKMASLHLQYLVESAPVAVSFTMILPARVRSLSNQVCQRPPP